MSAAQPSPDELTTPETETEVVRPARITLRLFTDGKNPTIDRLGLLLEVLGQMPDNERRAALAYAADFYGRRESSK
jgi:hypothetical protein